MDRGLSIHAFSRRQRLCSPLLGRPFPQGTQASDALHSALEKLRLANYPRMDEYRAVLVFVLAGFTDTLGCRGVSTPAVKLPPESPIVDRTEPHQEARVSEPKAIQHSWGAVKPHGSRDAGHTRDGAPPVRNGLVTSLNAVDAKRVGGLARAFYLAACRMLCA